ncbi:MAG: hypothetical protein P8J27_01415 [Mariniblastus sp.]|nr:hypothetical protein [Mariniblastus sp.]
MNTTINFTQNDLVLRLAGGPRDGEVIPVVTKKCFLGLEQCDERISGNPLCVIFRGSKGVVVRSFSDGVLFNGVPSAIHWLEQGDQIKFPNSLTVQIAQLGTVVAGGEEDEFEAEQVEAARMNEIAVVEQAEGRGQQAEECSVSSIVDLPALSDGPVVGQPVCEELSSQKDARLDLIEAELSELSSRNDETISRFDQLDDRISQLTEHMSQLVNLSVDDKLNPTSDEGFAHLCKPAADDDISEPDSDSPGTSTGIVEYHSDRDDSDEQIIMFNSELEKQAETQREVQGSSQVEGPLGDLQNQNANEQLPATSQNLTHSQDEEVAPFASKQSSDSAPELGPLASQLLAEVKREQEAETLNQNASEDKAEGEVTATQSDPVSPPKNDQSLADVLSRMESEGQWNGLPETIEEGESVEPIPKSPSPTPDVSPDEEMDDYISQLFFRIRGSKPTTAAKSEEESGGSSEPVKVVKAKVEPKFVPSGKPLKPEEFVPLRKAERIESLGKMRELANSTSRLNIKVSETQSRKQLGIIQLAITLLGMLMAAYYFVFATVKVFDLPCVLGMICLGISGYFGVRYYSGLKQNEELAELELVKAMNEAIGQKPPVAPSETEANQKSE